MSINTASGGKLYVSSAAVASSIDTKAEFEALTWVEVGEIETLGEFGDESNVVNFAALSDARVRKQKGTRDAGLLALVVGHDPRDAGQIKLLAAEESKFKWGFKIINPDAETAAYTDSIYYFRALVTSRRLNMGGNDNVVRRAYNIAIDSAVIEVPSALIVTSP